MSQVTEEIFQRQQQVRRTLRNAYVRLHGLEVFWERQEDSVERRDFYGDVLNRQFATVDTPIKLVLIGATVHNLIDAYENNKHSTQVVLDNVTFTGSVELGVMINKGDLIKIPHSVPDQPTTGEPVWYPFRVVDIKEAVHRLAISKQIIFTAYY